MVLLLPTKLFIQKYNQRNDSMILYRVYDSLMIRPCLCRLPIVAKLGQPREVVGSIHFLLDQICHLHLSSLSCLAALLAALARSQRMKSQPKVKRNEIHALYILYLFLMYTVFYLRMSLSKSKSPDKVSTRTRQ